MIPLCYSSSWRFYKIKRLNETPKGLVTVLEVPWENWTAPFMKSCCLTKISFNIFPGKKPFAVYLKKRKYVTVWAN